MCSAIANINGKNLKNRFPYDYNDLITLDLTNSLTLYRQQRVNSNTKQFIKEPENITLDRPTFWDHRVVKKRSAEHKIMTILKIDEL